MTAAPVLAKTFRYKLNVVSGENVGQSYAFEKPIVLIGRGPENDLIFANDPKMSRSHVEIRHYSGQLIVRNVSQKNLLFINGEKVEEKTLSGPATLQIGETILQLQPEQEQLPVQPQGVAKAVPMHQVQAQPPQNRVASKPLPSAARQESSYQAPSTYTAPPTPPPRAPRSAAVSNGEGNSRLRFYMIVIAVGAAVYWFVSNGTPGKKAETHLRTEGDVVRAIEDSAHVVQEIKKQQDATGQDSLQYRAAQEHYIKGFRDYRQGQYARAMQSFQAALSFYPNHELARKYLLQAQRKFEAQIDLSLAQGRKYYQKQNYRMCQSSFASVMMMVKDSTKLKYKEAKQLYDECGLRMEGGY